MPQQEHFLNSFHGGSANADLYTSIIPFISFGLYSLIVNTISVFYTYILKINF